MSKPETVAKKMKLTDYFKREEKSEETKTEKKLSWKKISSENLDCDLVTLFSKSESDELFHDLEKTIEYNTGDLAQVKIYGKWRNIPRKQAAFGDMGLSYKFSGNTIPAKPWSPTLLSIKSAVEEALNHRWTFNFVLVNRYENGTQHMGEHRDDEKELLKNAPIASLSLGQERDFVFKHKDTRGKRKSREDLDSVNVVLRNGDLLVMNPPTNTFWYHSLPVRKKAKSPRINLTFRIMTKVGYLDRLTAKAP